ncbi:MAG: FAD-dependent oxidoreductase [Burkholderiales bacterium]|nr:FAD-dependent oxidoreductase [Burkholderiales bacterium]
MKRIAVVGSGIAGLSAAWLLSKRYAVTLFEAAGTLGGHTHTVDVSVDGARFPVDTGFLVFNDRTYPNLCALFDHLGIVTAPSEMSFSVRVDEDRLEWAGSSLATVFAQKRNLVKPEFWRMLQDILRFNRESTAAVEQGLGAGETLGEFLDRGGYGRAFREWYLLPMSAAIWSCPTGSMLGFPAATFLRFCHNHGLLQVNGRPKWRTVAGGGREYVRRLAAEVGEVRLETPVLGVRRGGDHVEVRTAHGSERFDSVVLGSHSDQSLAMLEDADAAERDVLGSVRYQHNGAWLHTDETLLPRAREAWSAWNYLTGPARLDGRPVSVSYLINKLQPLPCRVPMIVTLNPVHEPRADRVIRRIDYSHPVFDVAAIEAQRRLPALQGGRRTWYCGAWTGYGFHEDGLRSGLAVANALGVKAPWQMEAKVA